MQWPGGPENETNDFVLLLSLCLKPRSRLLFWFSNLCSHGYPFQLVLKTFRRFEIVIFVLKQIWVFAAKILTRWWSDFKIFRRKTKGVWRLLACFLSFKMWVLSEIKPLESWVLTGFLPFGHLTRSTMNRGYTTDLDADSVKLFF